jgi:hypothetical protein
LSSRQAHSRRPRRVCRKSAPGVARNCTRARAKPEDARTRPTSAGHVAQVARPTGAGCCVAQPNPSRGQPQRPFRKPALGVARNAPRAQAQPMDARTWLTRRLGLAPNRDAR